MSKSKQLINFSLAILVLLTLNSRASSQNPLTTNANRIQPVSAAVETDRIRDGLAGPVRRVRTEVAKLSSPSGQLLESKRVVLEVAAYDNKGAKIENQYFPISGSALTGKEVYKYDEKGNISEMTLLNADGSLLSKEVYRYEYDSVGNWTKMTTGVAVVEGGKVTFEPTEVTYRSIMYYLDENMLKMAQPTAQPVASNPGARTVVPANKKSTPALPPAVAASDKLKAVGTVELKSSSASAGHMPVVAVDSEPPPPAPKPLLKPVSGGVLNGNAISLPAPLYPESARRMRIGGVVVVQVVLDETGKVISAQASDGPQSLREAAVQAALKARFSPTKLSGQPVKVTGIINYRFALPQ
jgi:TonB family protein